MADMMDEAAELSETFLQMALANKQKPLERTGNCLFCEEPLEDKTGAFCDSYCRDDFEKEDRIKNKLKPKNYINLSQGLSFGS